MFLVILSLPKAENKNVENDLVLAIQAKYMTFFVSACTVIALAIAPGVLSSEEPDWWEPSPLKQMQGQKN